jgi:hypothetical protein
MTTIIVEKQVQQKLCSLDMMKKKFMMRNETSFGMFGNVLLFGRELMNLLFDYSNFVVIDLKVKMENTL